VHELLDSIPFLPCFLTLSFAFVSVPFQQTNETTWERPKPPPTESDELPVGWVAIRHAATGQIFYQHEVTGEKRWTKPEKADDRSDIRAAAAGAASGKRKLESGETKSIDADTSADQKRSAGESRDALRARIEAGLDPLDPSQSGKRSGVSKLEEKMADSTASGALWQQRPYPAPGAVLKGKRK
jgi:polyglutamine-binding protein 1